jgi:hypothetical protein
VRFSRFGTGPFADPGFFYSIFGGGSDLSDVDEDDIPRPLAGPGTGPGAGETDSDDEAAREEAEDEARYLQQEQDREDDDTRADGDYQNAEGAAGPNRDRLPSFKKGGTGKRAAGDGEDRPKCVHTLLHKMREVLKWHPCTQEAPEEEEGCQRR